MKRFLLLMSLCMFPAFSQNESALHTLPAPAELNAALSSKAQNINVIEPHLGKAGKKNEIGYVGYPAAEVFDRILGSDWNTTSATITFYALDGYISRIPSAQFERYNAYLVFKRADGKAFTVNNHDQHEKVELGPYYLVWDNIASPELIKEGATNWPYQVDRIGLSRQKNPLPGVDNPNLVVAASLTAKYCLTCHRINGFGGEKYPVDLAEAGAAMPQDAFVRWVLAPSDTIPETTMPALLPYDDAKRRTEVAEQIYAYLKSVAEE